MKIAFYTDTYLPNIDGVVSQILASKKELEKRKHYVHVFTPGTRAEKKANRDKMATYYEGVKFPLYPQYKLALFPFASAWDAKKLGIQIIHCHAIATMGLASIFTAKTIGLPLIGTFHTMIPLTSHYLTRNKKTQAMLTSAAWKAIEAFYKPFDVVTAPSHVIAKLLEAHGVENVKVISNGVDTHMFNQKIKGETTRKKLGIDRRAPVFMFVGRITKEKRVDVVMKAFAKLNQPARLVVVGNGPYFEEVKKLHKKLKLGDKITLVGQVQYSEMPRYFAACDWQITASTFETQGLGILEGMACGKPCIGARALAIPETVKDNYNGFTFRSLDVNQCTEKMQKALATSNATYKKMSRNARLTGEKHSIEKTTSEWEKLYKSVL